MHLIDVHLVGSKGGATISKGVRRLAKGVRRIAAPVPSQRARRHPKSHPNSLARDKLDEFIPSQRLDVRLPNNEGAIPINAGRRIETTV